MAIGGKKNENQGGEFTKKVGLFLGKVVAINPTIEQYKEKLGMELKEDSKAAEYLGTSKDGNNTLRVDFWIEEDGAEGNDKYRKISYFLEDKVRMNKDGNKTQFINNVGMCSWGTGKSDLPEWFLKREYREAFVGEEDFYSFIRTWLGGLDYRAPETTLDLDWKKLMKGNVKDLKDQIGSEWAVNFGAMATIISKTKTDPETGEEEIKEYQGVYNKMVIPEYAMKAFKLVNYADPKVQAVLKNKASKDLKAQERFVLNVIGEYGCKDFYSFKAIHEYEATSNPVSSNEAVITEDDDY